MNSSDSAVRLLRRIEYVISDLDSEDYEIVQGSKVKMEEGAQLLDTEVRDLAWIALKHGV